MDEANRLKRNLCVISGFWSSGRIKSSFQLTSFVDIRGFFCLVELIDLFSLEIGENILDWDQNQFILWLKKKKLYSDLLIQSSGFAKTWHILEHKGDDGKPPGMSHNKQHITVQLLSSCKATIWNVKQSWCLLLSEERKLLNTPPTHARAHTHTLVFLWVVVS